MTPISLAGLLFISVGFSTASPTAKLTDPKSATDTCQVSQWTEWGLCQGSCDLGYQVRNREVTKPSLPVDGILLHPCPYLYEVRFCTPAVCFSETPNYNATEAGAKSNKSEETPLTNLLDLLNVPPQFPATNNRNDTNITSAIDVSNITTKSQLTTSFPSVLNQKATNVTILSTSALNISSTAGINISVTTTPLSSLLSTSKFNEEKSIETPLPFVPQNQATKTSDVDEDFPDIKDHKTKENEGTFDSALLIPVATQPPVIQPTFENVKAASPSKEAVFKLDEIATLGSNVVAKTEVWKANTTASVLNQTSAVEAETLSPNASIVVSTSTPDVSSSADHQMVYQEPLMSDKKVDVKEETLVAFPPPFDGDSVVISNIPFPKQFLPKAGSTADTNKTQNEVAVTTNKTLLAPIVSNISTSLSANSTQKSTSRTGSLATINSTATASPTTTTTTVLPSSTKVTSTTSPLTTTTTTETITTSKITEAPETVLTTQSTIPQSTTLESSTTTKVTPLPVSIGGGANTPILIKMVEVAGMTKDPLPQPYDPRNISSFQFERTTSRALPTTTTLKTTTKAPRPTPIIIREIGVGTTLDLTAIQRQRKQEISSNGASNSHFSSRAVNPRCHPVQARGKCPGGTKAQQVNRWVRMPGLEECSLYSYPYCTSAMEKTENPIRLEEECYRLCYTEYEKNNMDLFKRMKFTDGFRVDRV